MAWSSSVQLLWTPRALCSPRKMTRIVYEKISLSSLFEMSLSQGDVGDCSIIVNIRSRFVRRCDECLDRTCQAVRISETNRDFRPCCLANKLRLIELQPRYLSFEWTVILKYATSLIIVWLITAGHHFENALRLIRPVPAFVLLERK